MNVFRISQLKALRAKAIITSLELTKNVMKLIFFYKLNKNSTYTEFLITRDKGDDHYWQENEKASRQLGYCSRRLRKIYMEEAYDLH